jgi:hypothetical protein
MQSQRRSDLVDVPFSGAVEVLDLEGRSSGIIDQVSINPDK